MRYFNAMARLAQVFFHFGAAPNLTRVPLCEAQPTLPPAAAVVEGANRQLLRPAPRQKWQRAPDNMRENAAFGGVLLVRRTCG